MDSFAEQYLNAGKQLTPFNKKIPLIKNWNTKQVTKEQLIKHKGNFGWVLGKYDLVIDIDPRNGGEESIKKLCKDLDVELQPTVSTPSGGYHIYLKLPANGESKYKLKKNLAQYPGVDFLSERMGCIITGGQTEHGKYKWHADNFLDGFNATVIPDKLFQFLKNVQTYTKNNYDEDLGDFTGLLPDSFAQKKDVLDALNKLDPSMPHDDWTKIGMALHSWDDHEGLDIWEDWSKGGTNYEADVTNKKWNTFSRNHDDNVTLGTLFRFAKIADDTKRENEINLLLQQIESATDPINLKHEIIPEIKSLNLEPRNYQRAVVAIQHKFKEFDNGVKTSIANIRKLVEKSTSNKSPSEETTPNWCKSWVYINALRGYMNVSEREFYPTESFNTFCNGFLPIDCDRSNASGWTSHHNFIDCYVKIAYRPDIQESSFIQNNGISVFNSFNPNSIPNEAQEYTKEGLEIINWIEVHIDMICGKSSKNTHIFTQWLAHQIQYPGKKILWTPIVQSIPGTGKSFFSKLLRCCLGIENVGLVSTDQVISNFNAWATNVSVNVLEELRIAGHNRFDAVNKVKPLITDEYIYINDKGIRPYQTLNTTNYICFTNHRDCIPIDDDDRRWWVIFVPLKKLSEIEDYTGIPHQEYHKKLFDGLEKYAAEIRKWLLEIKITEEFMQTKNAPMTDHKEVMIATEEEGCLGLFEIREMLEKENEWYNKKVISFKDLYTQIIFEHEHLPINRQQLVFILKRLGYVALPRPISIEGENKRFWARRLITNDIVRDYLNKSI